MVGIRKYYSGVASILMSVSDSRGPVTDPPSGFHLKKQKMMVLESRTGIGEYYSGMASISCTIVVDCNAGTASGVS